MTNLSHRVRPPQGCSCFDLSPCWLSAEASAQLLHPTTIEQTRHTISDTEIIFLIESLFFDGCCSDSDTSKPPLHIGSYHRPVKKWGKQVRKRIANIIPSGNAGLTTLIKTHIEPISAPYHHLPVLVIDAETGSVAI